MMLSRIQTGLGKILNKNLLNQKENFRKVKKASCLTPLTPKVYANVEHPGKNLHI